MSISFPHEHFQDDSFAFTSQALRVAAAAADVTSGTGFVMLIAAVVFILILIVACFLDMMWLKESVHDADQPFSKQSTKRLWRSFKPGQSISGPTSQRDTADAQRSVDVERVSVSTGAAFSGRKSIGRRSSSTPSVSSAPPSQSHLQLEANRPTGPPTHRAPPTLCRALILPNETRYVIPMSSLVDKNSTWEVLGYSGHPVLKAAPREMDGGARRFVEISMTPPGSPILACAGSFPSATPGAGPALRILGAGGAPFGDLQQSPTGQQYHLIVDDVKTYTIIVDASGRLVFHGLDGVNLATVSRGREGGKPSLKIRVIPEVDSILVLSCVLAIVIFGGDAGRDDLMRSR